MLQQNCHRRGDYYLTQDNIDDIDDYLKQTFDKLLKDEKENNIATICNAVKEMRLIKYEEIKNILSI